MQPWTVVHLHGGRTTADYDGWPETAYYPGQVQTTVYDNKQPGTLLWYHDHGMAITRLNVYAGLAGLYLICDPQVEKLHLPRGADDHELLLLIQDRRSPVKATSPAFRLTNCSTRPAQLAVSPFRSLAAQKASIKRRWSSSGRSRWSTGASGRGQPCMPACIACGS